MSVQCLTTWPVISFISVHNAVKCKTAERNGRVGSLQIRSGWGTAQSGHFLGFNTGYDGHG